jgi:hypothetical protein
MRVIGCSCGGSIETDRELDYDYGQYYVVVQCAICGYYWEGYLDYPQD